MTTNIIIFQAVLISLFVAIVCVPVGIFISRKTKLIDYPGSALHKHHDRPMPMAGGIVLVIALAVSGTIFRIWQIPMVAPTFVAGLVIFAFGLWDDFKDISPLFKLIGQLLGITLLLRLGIVVEIFESPHFFIQLPSQSARIVDMIVTIIWMLGITNAFNFVDSMDGLTIGIFGLVAGFLLLMLASHHSDFALYCAVLVGISIGIYFFNAPPACIFLGDAGAQIIGFLLAALSIAIVPKNEGQVLSWLSVLILLGVPIFDMFLVVISRIRRKRPIYLSARDHTYHRLRKLGLGPNRSVLLMQIITIILGCLTIGVLESSPLIVALLFGFVFICGIVLLIFFEGSFSDSHDPTTLPPNE